uniref:Carbamoyl phosphate synthase small chain n=1 Tax=Porphyridium sordidum TaxID=28024 RepID=A0A1C9CDU4_PORSO|nr:carbamoyl-phosphate synthase arginine-specific small subunit [Porphyridium sordidum]AOM66559.1 carbamoyl-phosphate synthase arginine-specific small subunit [Porphyridium sordidum]
MINTKPKKALLVLEDGSIYKGWSFSKSDTVFGEIVFNTGMTGYQEILTDPSYSGQIINFTYPEFGNTGINNEDNESLQPSAKGVIVKNVTRKPSNWRNRESIIDYLLKNNILMIFGIDTRKLTKHLRDKGAMNCVISNSNLDILSLSQQLQKAPKMQGLNLVDIVTSKNPYEITFQKYPAWNEWKQNDLFLKKSGDNLLIALIDFGTKNSIIECLLHYSCKVIVLPANTSFELIKSISPDGILLSNGPGDPSTVNYAREMIEKIIDLDVPLFGICMGHQLLSLALGYQTYKLKFGHRGLNHPCGYDQHSLVTSQNHGFAVLTDSLNVNNQMSTSHLNLNDLTLAGLSIKNRPIFSVQYHPEAGPGPHDSTYLFKSFIELVRNNKISKSKK